MGYFLWFLNENIDTIDAANANANINASYTQIAFYIHKLYGGIYDEGNPTTSYT